MPEQTGTAAQTAQPTGASAEVSALLGLFDLLEPLAANVVSQVSPKSKVPGYLSLAKALGDALKSEFSAL